jgi:hypothetical protein
VLQKKSNVFDTYDGVLILIAIDSYNPIGNKISSCPPKDWRSPPVIDMYNRITKRLCDRFGMTWINTNDIMGVMWDRARDWCHYDDVSSDMEARYLLGMIFAT